MSLPIPPMTLEGHCSVIYNNTLYVYMPEAFISLPLSLHGEWKSLPLGESVSDAVCVEGGNNDSDAALYVVGGTSSNSSYPGLQRYLFEDERWETIIPGTMVTQSRLSHGATYLKASSSILVYGGSQGSTDPSSETFLISITSPYVVDALNSQGAPAVVSPSLLSWDDQTAVLIGGSSSNTNVFLFAKSSGWVKSSVSLSTNIPDNSVAMVLGSDGSKVLEIFNMSVFPNTVNSIALADANGIPAPSGQWVGTAKSSSSLSSHTRRQGITLASFPAYNGSLAPTTIRSSFSLAQSSNGTVVISGGSSTDYLCIFDQFQNSWVNATKLFNGDKEVQQPSATVPSSSSTMTAASTPTPSSSTSPSSSPAIATNPPATGSNGSLKIIIGATLGTLLGLAAILIIILLVLRRQTGRQKSQGSNNARRYSTDNKNRLSFQDQGLEPLARAAYPMALGPVPSVDSLAIVSGKTGSPRATPLVGSQGHLPSTNPQKPTPVPRVVSRWPDATTRLQSGLVETPVARSPPDERPRGDRTTDEGWSKYFKDINDAGLAGMEPARSTISSRASTKSDYRNSQWPSAPGIALGVLDEPQPLNRVQVGSPSTELFPSAKESLLHQSQAAKISSVDSLSIVSENDDQDPVDAFSSGVPASINDESSWLEGVSERPLSSNYTGSYYPPSFSHGIPDQSITSMGIDSRLPSSEVDRNIQRLRRDNINSDMSWLNLNGG